MAGDFRKAEIERAFGAPDAGGPTPTTETAQPSVSTAMSLSLDPKTAALDLRRGLGDGPFAVILVFCAAEHGLPELGRELNAAFEGTPLVGCTTAGEITPAGYQDDSICALGLRRGAFAAAAGRVAPLSDFQLNRADAVVRDMRERLEAESGRRLSPDNAFGFVLFDGLAKSEETVAGALAGALAGLPLFGGSAGDGLRFERTAVFVDGAFRQDCAALVLVTTDLRFRLFKSQHFVATDKKMVVTGADPARRLVTEINAEPAAAEYARLLGVAEGDLSPMLFATHPVVVRVGGQDYVRAIQRANPDGSLSFYCAIDEGIVLTVAEGRDLLERLEGLFDELRAEIGEPEVVLACDCVLRRVESEQRQVKHAVSRAMAANRVIGFSTFGEQFASMHVNQTFTGVAIGRSLRGAHGD